MDEKQIVQLIDARISKANSFTAKKYGDTPTDGNQLTPRQYVNLNGSVVGRPIGSVATIAQFYLATDTRIPMWFTANGTWVNGVGSVVASN